MRNEDIVEMSLQTLDRLSDIKLRLAVDRGNRGSSHGGLPGSFENCGVVLALSATQATQCGVTLLMQGRSQAHGRSPRWCWIRRRL